MDILLSVIFARVPCLRVEVWRVIVKCGYIRFMLLVFIQSFMFRYAILDLVYYFNRTLYG